VGATAVWRVRAVAAVNTDLGLCGVRGVRGVPGAAREAGVASEESSRDTALRKLSWRRIRSMLPTMRTILVMEWEADPSRKAPW